MNSYDSYSNEANLDRWYPKRKLNICILGGTGFVGKWLVNSLLRLHELGEYEVTLHIVTRNTQKSKGIFPQRFKQNIHWIENDLKLNTINNLPLVEFYVNGPTPSVVDSSSISQESLMQVTLNGVNSIKESLRNCTFTPRVINLSSGAVYSRARTEDSPHLESDSVIDVSTDLYASAKVQSERFLQSMNDSNEISLLNLRLFSFYGPHLPLDKHFAIGNFMQDIISGKLITVRGNSSTKRSFLYGADLATAILRALFSNYRGTLNIGGKNAISMESLAKLMDRTLEGQGVNFLGEGLDSNYYYPSTSLSHEILGSYENTPFQVGLNKWKKWLLKSAMIENEPTRATMDKEWS